MKRKQKEELRSKNREGLAGEIEKRQEEIYRLRLEVQSGKVKNTSSLRRKMDELAVAKTILKEVDLTQNSHLAAEAGKTEGKVL